MVNELRLECVQAPKVRAFTGSLQRAEGLPKSSCSTQNAGTPLRMAESNVETCTGMYWWSLMALTLSSYGKELNKDTQQARCIEARQPL